MSGEISLIDLLNVSIGSPEPGSVNFRALYALLHALLENLHLQQVHAAWGEGEGRGEGEGEAGGPESPGRPRSPCRRLEDKLRFAERQLDELERLPTGSELLSRPEALGELWKLLQLRGTVEANRDGVNRCVALIQDLLEEIRRLKESRDILKKEVEALQFQLNQINAGQLSHKISAVEQCLHQVEDLRSSAQELKEKMELYPPPEELSQCVTWEVLQAALLSERQKMKKELEDSITGTRTPITPSDISSPRAQRGCSTAPPSVAESEGSDGQVLESPRAPPSPPDARSDGGLSLTGGPPLSRLSSAALRYPETVEALRDVGRLQENFQSLEARVERLERGKADQVQVQQLVELLGDIGQKDMPENVLEQVNHLKGLMDSVVADKDKVLETSTAGESESSGLGEEMESESKSSQSKDSASPPEPQHLQIVYLRNSMQRLNEDVQRLKEDVAAASKSSADRQIHDQETDERTGQAQGAGQVQGQGWGQTRGQGGLSGQEGQAGQTYPSRMEDLSRKVSKLFQHYEKQQGFISTLIQQQDRGRTTSDLMSYVQGTILQLQAECEKLHVTTDHLLEGHSQKQNHIEHLYKTLEELDEKKADREVMEMEIGIKADKRALETKVSRIQFDTMTEQLNGMFQELLCKITDQEQDWHKVIEKISTEMECKLNRIELDPLKKQLEDRWKSIYKKLQAQPAPEHDDAAGFRKQLVAKFHCISCDRPVDLMTPGPHLLTVPSAPGLPSHKSIRPHTVYELEQARQHSRSLRPGTSQILRLSHSVLCRQVDRAQSMSDCRWNPELSCSQGPSRYPPILTPLRRTRRRRPKHERIPEMADYGYLTVSRSCGGSHTLTYANRRYSHQHFTQLIQTEDKGLAMSSSSQRIQAEEIDILGLDRHVYKGRLNNRAVKAMESRLPNISSKEGNCKSKDRPSRCQSHKGSGAEPGRGSPLRPQSAKSQGSRSGGSQRHSGTGSQNGVGSSCSVKDQPFSSMDCSSQSSADPDSQLLQDGDLPRVLSQSQSDR